MFVSKLWLVHVKHLDMIRMSNTWAWEVNYLKNLLKPSMRVMFQYFSFCTVFCRTSNEFFHPLWCVQFCRNLCQRVILTMTYKHFPHYRPLRDWINEGPCNLRLCRPLLLLVLASCCWTQSRCRLLWLHCSIVLSSLPGIIEDLPYPASVVCFYLVQN